MNSNPDFIMEVIITPPRYSVISDECADFVQEYVDELENVVKMIQDYANIGEYMFNTKYPIASNIFLYYCCANPIFAPECGL